MVIAPTNFTLPYFQNLSWDTEPLLWRTLTTADVNMLRPDQVAAAANSVLPPIWLIGNCGSPSEDAQGHTLYIHAVWNMADWTKWTTVNSASVQLWHGFPNRTNTGTVWVPVATNWEMMAQSGTDGTVINGGETSIIRVHGLPTGMYRLTVPSLVIPAGDSLEIWVQRNR